MKISNSTKGIFYACISGMTFGMNPLFAKPLLALGMKVPSILFYRFLIGALMVALYHLSMGGSLKTTRKILPFNILNGFCIAGSALFLFKSYEVMDSGIATAILFTYPVIVPVIMGFFHEKVNWMIILCIILSMLGVYSLNASGTMGSHVSLKGILFVLASSLCFSLYMVFIKVTPLNKLNSNTQSFYSFLFSLPIFYLNIQETITLPPNARCLLLISLLALFTTVISLVTTALAIQFIGPTLTCILEATEPLTSIVIGVLVFQEAFTPYLVVGMILILLAVTIIILQSSPKQPKTVSPPQLKQ